MLDPVVSVGGKESGMNNALGTLSMNLVATLGASLLALSIPSERALAAYEMFAGSEICKDVNGRLSDGQMRPTLIWWWSLRLQQQGSRVCLEGL